VLTVELASFLSPHVGVVLSLPIPGSDSLLDTIVEYSIQDKVSSMVVSGSGGKMDVCGTFDKACSSFLTGIKCPSATQLKQGCSTGSSYSSFVGRCSCGTIDASEQVLNSILSYSVSGRFASTLTTANSKVDICKSYSSACTQLFSDIGCPASLQQGPSSCVGSDWSSFAGVCKCGQLDASQQILLDMTEYAAPPSLAKASLKESALAPGTVDMCGSYESLCSSVLTKVGTCRMQACNPLSRT
jgi:hypothetical protein